MVDAIDDHIDLAVVEEIPECRAPRWNYVCQAGALDRWHHLKLLAMIKVVKQ